jgi:hypothetical protein
MMHYLLFRLSELGLCASLAPPGSQDVDIYVSQPKTNRLASIQVKTRGPRKSKGWLIKTNRRLLVSKWHYFVFVEIPESPIDLPVSYVVPSKVVAKVVSSVTADRDDERRRRYENLLGENLGVRRSSVDIHVIEPLLRNPPKELEKDWMRGGYLEAYWQLFEPLFQSEGRRSERASNPDRTES